MPVHDRLLAQRIEAKAAQLAAYRPFDVELVRKLDELVTVSLTYHSNAIEGSTMQLVDVDLALSGAQIPGNHTAEEIAETVGHAQAWQRIQADVAAGAPLRAEFIWEIHDLVKPYHPQRGGWRTGPVYIRGAQHTPPPAFEVPRYMNEWLRYVNKPLRPGSVATLDRAAQAHSGFETVHPFLDGNGRTGRLLLNWMLLRDGFPPAIIRQEERARYITALQAASPPGPLDYRPLAQLVAECVDSSLTLYLSQLVPDEGYHEMTFEDAARRSGLSTGRLRELAELGMLEARKHGKRWITWPAALDIYLQTRNKAGRPAKRLQAATDEEAARER